MTPDSIVEQLKLGAYEDPNHLADFIVEIWGAVSRINALITDLEADYVHKWQEYRRNCKTDKQCDMDAKLTEEYKLMRKAQSDGKILTEMARSFKRKLSRLEEEHKEAKY